MKKFQTAVITFYLNFADCLTGVCTAYRCGPLIDLCKGPHVPDTGKVKAFGVSKNSSAYWKGNDKNDSLQRVYGMSFPTVKEFKQWEAEQEKAAKRDHRLQGKVCRKDKHVHA